MIVYEQNLCSHSINPLSKNILEGLRQPIYFFPVRLCIAGIVARTIVPPSLGIMSSFPFNCLIRSFIPRNADSKGTNPIPTAPAAKGTTVSRFATHAGEPGVIYAANNHGLFRSDDAGWSWKALDLPWPEPGLADGVSALACLPE